MSSSEVGIKSTISKAVHVFQGLLLCLDYYLERHALKVS